MRRPHDLLLERRSGGLRLPGATKWTFFCLFTSFSMFCFHRELLRQSEHVRPSVCLSSTDLKRLSVRAFPNTLSMADCWTPVKLPVASPLPAAKLLPPIRVYTQAHACTASLYKSNVWRVNTGARGGSSAAACEQAGRTVLPPVC